MTNEFLGVTIPPGSFLSRPLTRSHFLESNSPMQREFERMLSNRAKLIQSLFQGSHTSKDLKDSSIYIGNRDPLLKIYLDTLEYSFTTGRKLNSSLGKAYPEADSVLNLEEQLQMLTQLTDRQTVTIYQGPILDSLTGICIYREDIQLQPSDVGCQIDDEHNRVAGLAFVQNYGKDFQRIPFNQILPLVL